MATDVLDSCRRVPTATHTHSNRMMEVVLADVAESV